MSIRKRLKRWLYGSCPGFAGSFPYFGFRIHFPPRSKSFVAACEQGIFEADIVRLLQKLATPGTHVFDVGGNIGLMAAPVLRACPTCTVVSFEPSPNSLPYLRRTIAESGCEGRWLLVGKGLSSKAGDLDFALGGPEDSLFEGFKSHDRISNARVVKVTVSTLDDEWERLGRPAVSVVKVDVEGAEGSVLEGGARLLAACRPFVIVEWYADFLKVFGTSSADLLRIASGNGYAVYSIPQGVPIADARTLSVQMLSTSNFLLAP